MAQQAAQQASQQASQQNKKSPLCVALLAHVDAGKTTLSEAMLYTSGQIRKLGRVDHGDAFLDNFSLERERGITIFSKQAQFAYKERDLILLDTPGHVDFSAEMERTLQVLDYAVLLISAADGIQGHTKTLWKLLAQYEVPVFLFVNKMDQPGADKEKLLHQLQENLDANCLEFGPVAEAQDGFAERLAMCDEALLDEFLETARVRKETVAKAISARKLFPCFFGAALKLEGVEDLLDGLCAYADERFWGEEFGARVYKISRDSQGNRLTHLRVTGGSLRVKMLISNRFSKANEEAFWEEKADQLRIYTGAQYEMTDCVPAGGVCAVTGLKNTFAGQGLGAESENTMPVLVPVLTYHLELPEGSDPVKVLGQMRLLEEEEPQLKVVWREALREIHVQVMGEVQIEVLKHLIRERFDLEVEFGDGRLLYKETIAAPVIGIGHFEPLRHYAEVHLLMEPAPPGSGLQFASACNTDTLDKNWQRLILTHLEEKSHLGVLTGSPITDMKITLLKGKAHLKHTEGGDFRQATYRALRQGLMQAQNVLLEPVLAYVLEVPTEQIGRAMSDLQKRHGSFEPPVTMDDGMSILTGTAPVACMRDYQREVSSYTRGMGRYSASLKGYEPCHNSEEVIGQIGYLPDADVENPSSSVFCAHGAGYLVEWNQVPEMAHLESSLENVLEDTPDSATGGTLDGTLKKATDYAPNRMAKGPASQTGSSRIDTITLEEIEAIFKSTYKKSVSDYEPYRFHQMSGAGTGGAAKADGPATSAAAAKDAPSVRKRPVPAKESYLLVDGYNIIFAWEDLKALAQANIDSARDRLMEICCNYQGCIGGTLILVFDAYKVKGNPGSVQKYHNIYVVYTKEAETADQYIEKTVHEIGKKHHVTVATSDALEQMIIWGDGAIRLSAPGFREAIDRALEELREEYLSEERRGINRLEF